MDSASDDIFHLNSCLARYDRDLWIHMTGHGFHLSSVFHGAFMRLFAFYMPTATVYRFWDLLFSETTRYHHGNHDMKHIKARYPRHSLIDLAYGAMKFCRSTLLKCESEREFRDCLIGFFEALYDPSTMIEITTQAERELWEAPHTTHLGVEPEHMRDYDANVQYYRRFLEQFRSQNEVLRFLTQEIQINAEGARNKQQQPGQPQQQVAPNQDTRMTARNVVAYVIMPLRALMVPEGEGMNFGGMFRKTSDIVCELGPQMDAGAFGTMKYIVWTKLGRQMENLTHWHHHDTSRIAVSMPVMPKTMGEPTQLSKNEWTRQV